ncbi:hypothetical protein QAD02_007568 [Eretmocerus hayati]|uniref:Uncharacterized protein n=1 Tax=Eretmocerus hayati TaxID=131215 RepID=A0ACC2N5E1_9HYME|nr:hypothetical protein QAD02_007568 [Eretmocerus hayati]
MLSRKVPHLIDPNLQDHPERHLIIRMVMALALLPPDTIVPTYEAIKRIARKKFGNFFNEFFKYFDDYWIKRRGVERFCVYEKLDKTNNEQESMHKVLNYLFRHRQPHPWQFVGLDDDSDQNHVENSISDTLDVISVGGVDGANNYDIRIDIKEIEELFDSNHEGNRQC